jgi:hypothetical protein
MDRQRAGTVATTTSPSALGTTTALAVAVIGQLALLDAAVETVFAGSPVRWSIALPAIAFFALSIFLWRPGGPLLRRRGPAGAAAWSVGGLLLLLVASAWLPGGQADGVRLLLQRTPTLLMAVTAAAVTLAAVVLVRVCAPLPAIPRLIACGAFMAVAAYALVALGVALYNGVPYAALFHGGAVWQRLPRWLQGTFLATMGLVPAAIIVAALRFVGQLRRKLPAWSVGFQAVALCMSFVMALAGVRLPEVADGAMSSTAGGTDSLPLGQQALARPATEAEKRAALGRAVERLPRYFQALDAVAKEIARDTFDPQAVVEKVGRVPDKLFGWVRDNTYWVPYQGALRGPTGVLMDRLGNSLDRSLLLAELLRVAGHDVRLARATFPHQQAKDLLAKVRPMPQAAAPASGPSSTDQAEQSIAKFAADHQLDLEELRTSWQRQVVTGQQQAEELAKLAAGPTAAMLRDVPKPQAAAGADPDGVAAMVDHWWVQWQQDGKWVDLDPLLPDAQPDAALLSTLQTIPWRPTPGRLPLEASLWHQVTIRVVIEQARDGKLTERVPLSHTLTPAEVIGQRIELRQLPLKWPADLDPRSGETYGKAFLKAAAEQKAWVPALSVGQRVIMDRAITETGDLADKSALSGEHDVGNAAGGMMEGFGGMLGGGGEEPAAKGGVLTAEWIEYAIRAPGQPLRKIRRQIFDLVGPAARAARKVEEDKLGEVDLLERALALLGQTEIAVPVCRLSSDFLVHLTVERLLANREVLLTALAEDGPQDSAGVDKMLQRAQSLPGALYALTFTRHAGSPVAGDTYLDRPNIFNLHDYLRPISTGAQGMAAAGPDAQQAPPLVAVHAMDIVDNAVAVRPDKDAFAVRLRQGILDTAAETVLLGGAAGNVARMWNAVPGWKLLKPGSAAELRNTSLTADLQARVEQDLTAGYLVMIPQGASATQPLQRGGWWRIDARTGQALGMGDNGWGQGMTEESILRWTTIGGYIVSAHCLKVKVVDQLDTGSWQSIRWGILGCIISLAAGVLVPAFLFVVGASAGAGIVAGVLAGVVGNYF